MDIVQGDVLSRMVARDVPEERIGNVVGKRSVGKTPQENNKAGRPSGVERKL
jgi:hypothetical protein